MGKATIIDITPRYDRYGTNKEAQLTELADDSPVPGYPKMSDRWHVAPEEWDEMAKTGVITVPDGPWNVVGHPDRDRAREENLPVEDEFSVTAAQTAAWRKEGLLVTDKGFPVHPLGRLGVTSALKKDGRRIGMVTGLGRHLRPGPIAIGNLAVSRQGDKGDIEYAVVGTPRRTEKEVKYRLSFPGGYAEPGESVEAACLREGNEEASLGVIEDIIGNPLSSIVRRIIRISPSLGGPNTLNAWLEENFAFAETPNSPEIRSLLLGTNDPREVRSVLWVPEKRLIENSNFMGAHRRALLAHIALREEGCM